MYLKLITISFAMAWNDFGFLFRNHVLHLKEINIVNKTENTLKTFAVEYVELIIRDNKEMVCDYTWKFHDQLILFPQVRPIYCKRNDTSWGTKR